MPSELTLLSTLAVMGVLQDLIPSYAAANIAATYAPTRELMGQIARGAKADAAILTDDAIDTLIATGTLQAGSRVDIARSFIGIAVRAGAPHPDISTAGAFRQAMLDAPGIAYSAAGASGLFFAQLIQTLGIADAVQAKATVIPTGLTGALAADGRVTIAVQQISELMVVPGIDIVGRLPATLHGGAVFSGGVFAGASAGARDLLAFLASPSIRPILAKHGVEPVQ